MRQSFRMGAVLVAAMLLLAVIRLNAQGEPGSTLPEGQAGGQRRGGMGGQAGGFAGGQMIQGTVTAATADKLTLKTETGESYDVTVTANTRIMKDRQPVKLTDLKVGDAIGAMGLLDAPTKTVHAMMLTAVDAETIKKAKENLGKTYIAGKITAIDADNLKLTVMRTDNVSQVIQVDEGTSFQKGTRGIATEMAGLMGGGMGGGGGRGMGGGGGGGRPGAGAAAPAPESITLADVKVGDTVMATGGLKGGIFTPVKMGVAEPAPAGAGRRRGGGGTDAAAPPPAQ